MDEKQIIDLTLSQIAEAIKSGELTSLDLVEACLKRIERLNPTLNAFLTVLSDSALDAARQADEVRQQGGDLGSLHGIPVGIKDLIDVAGVLTTAGSDFLRDNLATHDAEVIQRLRAAGAIVIGKNHLHEFAIGATNVNPHFGPAHNPWNTDYSPGGSSGGSAAAVAAGLCPAAIGTDTGGSVRMPAALCNLTGLRPARGRISTQGVIPMSWSLDTVGPIVRTAADAALMVDALATEPTNCVSQLEAPIDGLRIGLIAEDFIWSKIEPAVETLVRTALDTFRDLGLSVSDAPFPLIADAQRGGGFISLCDALVYHHERLENEAERFGEDVRGRLQWAQERSGFEYAWARQVGREVRAYLADLFLTVDVLALPTTPQASHKIAGSEGIAAARNLLRLTYPIGVSLLPSISIPCGFTPDGFPVGLQLLAPAEARLTQVGHVYQQATDWHARRPSLD